MMLVRKDVLKLAIPILTEQIFVMSLGMINTMMAGNIGKEAVSAIGMVDSINNMFIAFFSAMAVGGTVVVAQYIGQRNIKRANDAMKQALYSSLIIAIIITIIIWIFHKQLISILFGSADIKVIDNAYIYLGITLLTYPMISIDLVANGILRGAGDTKTPMKITIFMNFINVILSYFFIYGIDINNIYFHFHIPAMGIVGAALAIAIARIIGALIIFTILLRGTKIIKLKKVYKFKFDMELLNPIFGIGIPSSIESLLFFGGKLITQIYIVDMGTVAIASNTIVSSIANMLNIPGSAFCIAATALVGQYMGKRDSNEAKNCLSYITKLSTICLVVLCALSVPLAKFMVLLYTNNQEIVKLSVKILIFNALFIIIWSNSFVLPSGMRGAGDVKYAMITSIIGMWIFRITLGYVLGISLKLGLTGVWLGMYIDWFVRSILYYLRFRNGKWKAFVVLKPSIQHD